MHQRRLHVYERGKHGVGLAPADPILSTWAQRLADCGSADGTAESVCVTPAISG